jgi:hypothetical protein
LAVALFFNTEYFDQEFSDDIEAAEHFSKMVLGLKQAINQGAENYLVSAANAVNTVLAFNYSVSDWVNDRRRQHGKDIVDRDLQRYFASKLNRAPFSEDRAYQDNEAFLENEIEVKFRGTSRTNLSGTLAFMYSGALVSPKLAIFSEAFVECSVISLSDETYYATLRCISDEATCSEHFEHIRTATGIQIKRSCDIWIHRDLYFPNLDFCSRVKDQLNSISQWNVILERLLELQEYSDKWKSGSFNFQEIPSKASPEGEQVRKNGRAVQERTFLCSDEQSRVFYWHLRATPGAIRIYFYPYEDGQNSKIIIGHIGSKPYYP